MTGKSHIYKYFEKKICKYVKIILEFYDTELNFKNNINLI